MPANVPTAAAKRLRHDYTLWNVNGVSHEISWLYVELATEAGIQFFPAFWPWVPAFAGTSGWSDAHHTRRASLGSSLSRNPSPSTFTASTVSARQMPEKKMLCG